MLRNGKLFTEKYLTEIVEVPNDHDVNIKYTIIIHNYVTCNLRCE